MDITVEVSVNDSQTKHYSLEDLSLTEEEWKSMTEKEQEEHLYNFVHEENDEPGWYIESFQGE